MDKIYFGPWRKVDDTKMLGSHLRLAYIRPTLNDRIVFIPTGEKFIVGESEIFYDELNRQYCIFMLDREIKLGQGSDVIDEFRIGKLEDLMEYSDANSKYSDEYYPNQIEFLSQEDFDRLTILL